MNRSRPRACCIEDIIKTAGKTWMRDAQNREVWQKRKEAYTHPGVTPAEMMIMTNIINAKHIYLSFNAFFFVAVGENRQNDEFRPRWKSEWKTVSDLY